MHLRILLPAVVVIVANWPGDARAIGGSCQPGQTKSCTAPNGCAGVNQCIDGVFSPQCTQINPDCGCPPPSPTLAQNCLTPDGCAGIRFWCRDHWMQCIKGAGSTRGCFCGGYTYTYNGSQACNLDGTYGVCQSYTEGLEICDGCDNDRNGLVDAVPYNPYACATGGVQSCVNGQWSSPVGCGGSAPCTGGGTRACNPDCSVQAVQACFGCNPAPGTMTFNVDGPNEWPAACWGPFNNNSNPFYREIPATAKVNQVDARSFDIVQQMLTQWRAGELQGRLDGKSGEPTYYSDSTMPAYTLKCRNDPYGASQCPPGVEGSIVTLPEWALPEGGSGVIPGTPQDPGPDGHVTIVDQASNIVYDLWQVQTAPLPAVSATPPPDLIASWANVRPLTGDGLYPFGQRAAIAAGWSNLLGRIRLEELQAGEINHALFMYVVCHNGVDGPARGQVSGANVGVVFPATGQGRPCNSSPAHSGFEAKAPPMGAHFFYNLTPQQIDELNIQPWKKTILKALSRYGAFVGDTADNWGFEQESSYGYSSVENGARRWYDFGAVSGWTVPVQASQVG